MANAQTGGFHIVHICCVMNLIMKHDFSKHEFSQQTMEVRFRHWLKSKKGNCDFSQFWLFFS